MQIPVHRLETPFKMYHYEGSLPHRKDLLVPHRKDHHLIVFTQKAAGTRQWIDMRPIVIQDQAIYFTNPQNVIMKEDVSLLWSIGLAFTDEFLALQDITLRSLPILNDQHVHELILTEPDQVFVADLFEKLAVEYKREGEWQQKMILAHLTVLLTYLSRSYTEQYGRVKDQNLLKKYQSYIDTHFREWHEIGNYAGLMNLSAGHLSEMVKAQSGKPAIKHIHDRLVLEAKRLLFHSEISLKEIAFDLGFTDASYFSRFFKRETGQPPADYRLTTREMYQ